MHSATGHALLRIMYTPSNINVTTTTLYSLRSLSPNVVNHHAAVLDPAKYGYCLVVAPTLQAQAVDGHNFVTWEGNHDCVSSRTLCRPARPGRQRSKSRVKTMTTSSYMYMLICRKSFHCRASDGVCLPPDLAYSSLVKLVSIAFRPVPPSRVPSPSPPILLPPC